MLNLQTVIVPILDIDARLYGDRPIGARGKLERRIVAGLIAHLTEAGWLPSGLFDGDTTE